MRWTPFFAGCLVLGLTVLAAAGCNHKIVPEKPGTVHKLGDLVARVNGQEFTWQDMDRRAQNALRDEVAAKKLFIPRDRQEEALQFFRRQAVQIFVNKTVLLAEAKRRGIHVTDADRQTTLQQIDPFLKARGFKSFEDFLTRSPMGEKITRHEFEDGLYVDKYIGEEVRSKIVVVDADRDKFVQDVTAQRHAAKRKADDTRQQLVKGTTDFAALAKQNSESLISSDLGELTRGKMDKAIEDVVFNLKGNEISPVLEVPVGYDIIKVTGRTAAKAATATTPAVSETLHASHVLFRAPPLQTAKSIDNAVRMRKYDEAFKALLHELRSKAKIETIYTDMVF